MQERTAAGTAPAAVAFSPPYPRPRRAASPPAPSIAPFFPPGVRTCTAAIRVPSREHRPPLRDPEGSEHVSLLAPPRSHRFPAQSAVVHRPPRQARPRADCRAGACIATDACPGGVPGPVMHARGGPGSPREGRVLRGLSRAGPPAPHRHRGPCLGPLGPRPHGSHPPPAGASVVVGPAGDGGCTHVMRYHGPVPTRGIRRRRGDGARGPVAARAPASPRMRIGTSVPGRVRRAREGDVRPGNDGVDAARAQAAVRLRGCGNAIHGRTCSTVDGRRERVGRSPILPVSRVGNPPRRPGLTGWSRKVILVASRELRLADCLKIRVSDVSVRASPGSIPSPRTRGGFGCRARGQKEHNSE